MTATNFAELIAKIAHELRSPLTSVKGFSSTLLKRWDRFSDEQRKQFVETIYADAERMGRIITEVLDLARLESGRMQLNLVDAEIDVIVRNAAEDLAALPGADRIELGELQGTTVRGDPERLRHVVRNVLENAVRFSDDGPVSVSAQTSDDRVTIAIRDRGIGIAAERVGSVFEGPSSNEGVPSGSGLGLYLSKKLVEAHEGEIGVTSAPGEGSTFSITLPAGEET